MADGASIAQPNWHLSKIYTIYPVWRHRHEPGVMENTEHVFPVLVPRDISIVLNPRERLNHGWQPCLEAADKCFTSSNAAAILQLQRQLRQAGN